MEPLASENLSQTDVTIRWEFPTGVFREHFAHLFARGQRHLDFLVRDSAERDWLFRLSIRGGNYPKPSIRGEWIDFVKAKGLQEGDQVILYRLQDEAAGGVEYRIEVIYRGAFRLFGQRINL